MNCFYCSGYTSEGFYFNKINLLSPESFRYILKGYPNSIKQKIFNSICEKLEKDRADFTVYKNYDSSIYGIECQEKNFLICDGTFPFDDKSETYGVNDREIHLDMFQDRKILSCKSGEILSLNSEIQAQIRRCKRFLEASQGLLKERMRLEKDSVDTRKISRYCNKLWSSYGCYPNGRVGVEKEVFSSVVRSDGAHFVGDDLLKNCDTGIIIADPVGNIGNMIIDRVRRYALGSGVDVISCKSYVNPRENFENLIVPNMRFGIFTSPKIDVPNIKRVRTNRFLINKANENIKVRLQFNKRADEALMKEVFLSIKEIEQLTQKRDLIFEQATDEKELTEYVLKSVI